MPMRKQDFAARVEARYNSQGGMKASAIPWAQIISTLLPLIVGCLPVFAKRHARNHPEATKERMLNALKENHPTISVKDRKDVVEAAYAEFTSMNTNDIQSAQGLN